MGELNSVEALWAARLELPKSGNGRKAALWRVISGLEAGKEDELSPGERAAGIKKLLNVFARVLKNEFREQREKDRARREVRVTNGGSVAAEDLGIAVKELEERDVQANSLQNMDELPRSVLWDPVACVCNYLSIAERMLSRLGREVCGVSAQQMADRLRVRAMRPGLRAELEEFVRREVPDFHDGNNRPDKPRGAQLYLLSRWREYKRDRVEESNAARAVKYGFKYPARLQMACLMEYGITLEGMELEELESVATYYAARCALGRRAAGIEHPFNAPHICRTYAIKPYTDLWATLWREKREWLMAMKAKWGLDEWLEKHVAELGE